MEWSRIKSILICVFAAANVFLFVVYIGMNASPSVSEEEVTNTLQILAANGVELSQQLVSRSIEKKKVCGAENRYGNTEEFLADAWHAAQRAQRDYFNPAHTETQGDTFLYRSAAPQNAADAADAERYAAAELQALAVLPEQYRTHVQQTESDTEVTFYLTYDNRVIFDSSLSVVVADGGIVEISGQNWLLDTLTESGMTDTKAVTELLITFAADRALQRPAQVRIAALEEGYHIGPRTERQKTAVVPALKIVLSSGGVFYYDARNGELLQHEL